MLESKKLSLSASNSTACEFEGCGEERRYDAAGSRSATTAMYVAGYPFGSFCDVHAKVMRAAWITDEALMSQRRAVAA